MYGYSFHAPTEIIWTPRYILARAERLASGHTDPRPYGHLEWQMRCHLATRRTPEGCP